MARGCHLRFVGTYIFLRDVHSAKVWSAGYQPSSVEADSYEVEYSEDRAEIVRRDGAIRTTLEVASRPRMTPKFAASRSRISATVPARSS